MENNHQKAVIVVAFRDFRDPEYFIPRQILEEAGVEIKTASNKKGTAIGAEGGDTEVDLLVSEIDIADFNAVIFVGGPGCLKGLDNEDSYKVIHSVIQQKKVLASICISPVILAKAGVLKDKQAVVWNSPMDKSGIRELESRGAKYLNKPVVQDGLIITASGPQAAESFAKTVLEELRNQS